MAEPQRYKLLLMRNCIHKKQLLMILTLGAPESTKNNGAKKPNY